MKRIVTSVLCGLIAFLTVFTGVFRTVDNTAEDMLYHHAGNINANIKIIKIDDKTMNKMGDFYSQRGKGQGKGRLLHRFRYFELSTYTKIKRVDSFHTD